MLNECVTEPLRMSETEAMLAPSGVPTKKLAP